MIRIHISPSWILRAIGSKHGEPSPQLHCENGTVCITTFYEEGIGMRTVYGHISSKDSATIEISPTIHAFIKRVVDYPTIEMRLQHGAMTVVAETPHAALQYTFPRIHRIEHHVLESSEKDTMVSVSANDWLLLCRALSNKGFVTITATTDSKAITLKHSGNRWGAAIHAKKCATKMRTFHCQSGVLRDTFSNCVSETAFADITFMEIGVLQWTSGLQTVYIAPNKQDDD